MESQRILEALANRRVLAVFERWKDGPPTSLAFISVQDMRMKIMHLSGRYYSLRAFLPEDGPAQTVHSGAAVDASGRFAAVKCAFAPVAEFAARGAAPSAVFEVHWCFSWPLAGVLFPAVAAASGVPDFVWRPACPVVADISGP